MSVDNLDPKVFAGLVSGGDEIDLNPLSPEKAIEMYEEIRKDELADSTLRTHLSRLSFFEEWCDEYGIEHLNEIDGLDLYEFRSWRSSQVNSTQTLKSNLQTVRIFLRKCVKFDAVHPLLPEKIDIPSLAEDEISRDDVVEADYARQVLDRLRKYDYATVEHVVWVLFAEAGLRVSAMHSLDVDDFVEDDDGAKLQLRHRPDSDTRLKNKRESQRFVHLSSHTAQVVIDYLDEKRPDVTDSFGREPLLASRHGRLRKTTMRKYAYKWTRPCVITGSCPHGYDPEHFDDCDGRDTSSTAYKCPSSKSPHAVRRGYLTAELNAGVPITVLSDRCDVSPEVIEEYYDKRSDIDRMRLRKELRERAYSESDKSGYARE